MSRNNSLTGAWITGGATLVAALIGAGTIFFGRPDPQPPIPKPDNPPRSQVAPSLEVVSIQPVEQPIRRMDGGTAPTAEMATFRLVVRNTGNSTAKIETGHLRLSRVDFVELPLSATFAMARMDHRGHFAVVLDDPRAGLSVPVDLNIDVAPQSTAELTLWLKPSARYPRAELVDMSASLTMEFQGQEVTSNPFRVLLYSGEAVTALTNPSELFRNTR